MIPEGSEYAIHHGDAIPHMAEMPAASVDLAVFSPPFPSVYAYTSLPEDLGNSEDFRSEAKLHFGWFFRGLARVLKPGRVAVLHCTQIPRMKRSGGNGLFDFRGFLIRLGERSGLTYEYDWLVRKNPQAQAIRTRSRELQFAGLESDRAKSRGALGDYLIKFRAPGDNAVAVSSVGQVSRNQWIAWAEGFWEGIREGNTLNTKEAKGPDDVRHICPLQLDVIERLVRLYSDPGEVVFSPFAGIGSELAVALELGRRGYGCEIKPEYHAAAVRNCDAAIRARDQANYMPLFDGFADESEDAEDEREPQGDPWDVIPAGRGV